MTPNRRRMLQLLAAGGVSLAGCSSLVPDTNGPSTTDGGDGEGIDDWQYDPTEAEGARYAAADGEDLADDSIGLAAGGAADVSTFRRNVQEGYLPIPESLPYEGLFYDYYFDTGGDGACESLFCPAYTPAVSPDPLSGETDRYLTVGLDSGLSQSDFERPALNLVIVLDISGSMNSSFDRYYYDRHGNRKEAEGGTSRPKIEVAKEALADLTHHLRPEDRLGVVLFNSGAYVAKPLRLVEETDMEAIRGHIRDDIEAHGGTNVSAALREAEDLMAEYDDADHEEYENRSILLTDAQINVGETDADELRSGLQQNAERGHHTTVIGVGVDFNADLVDQITSVRGANYYSVYSESQFERRLDEQFEYMVTPLVYDLSLELDADDYEIAAVYGTTAADEATGELMHVRTLFPSPRTEGEARGGVVLVEVAPTSETATATESSLTLEASWETRAGDRQSTTRTIEFPDGDGEHYGNDAVRKAILLARYADLLKNWTIYERERDRVADDEGIPHPPEVDVLGEWELQSEPLTVSERYADRIGTFHEHFEAEATAIGDEDLERELDLMEDILDAAERDDAAVTRTAAHALSHLPL